MEVCKKCGVVVKNIGRHLQRNRCKRILELRQERSKVK